MAPNEKRTSILSNAYSTNPTKLIKFKGMKIYISYKLVATDIHVPMNLHQKHFYWPFTHLAMKFLVILFPNLPEKQAKVWFYREFITWSGGWATWLVTWCCTQQHLTGLPEVSQQHLGECVEIGQEEGWAGWDGGCQLFSEAEHDLCCCPRTCSRWRVRWSATSVLPSSFMRECSSSTTKLMSFHTSRCADSRSIRRWASLWHQPGLWAEVVHLLCGPEKHIAFTGNAYNTMWTLLQLPRHHPSANRSSYQSKGQ